MTVFDSNYAFPILQSLQATGLIETSRGCAPIRRTSWPPGASMSLPGRMTVYAAPLLRSSCSPLSLASASAKDMSCQRWRRRASVSVLSLLCHRSLQMLTHCMPCQTVHDEPQLQVTLCRSCRLCSRWWRSGWPSCTVMLPLAHCVSGWHAAVCKLRCHVWLAAHAQQ